MGEQSSASGDLTKTLFEKFRDLIQSETGIHLRDSKRILVSNRLRKRVVALDLESYEAYYAYLTGPNSQSEMREFIDAISTNETYFYRGENQFDALRTSILPRMFEGRRSLNIWSAACSTGEEPYSILIAAIEAAMAFGWTGQIKVAATDISEGAIKVAKEGVYEPKALRNLPAEYRDRFLEQREDGKFTVGQELRDRLHFGRQNLLKDEPPLPNADIIFCRNALMYFTRDTQERIVNRSFAPVLASDGYLFIGSSESFVGMNIKLSYSGISGCQIYSRKTTEEQPS